MMEQEYTIAEGPVSLTDTGNGERFAAQHGHCVKYVHPWNKWLVWDDSRWQFDHSGQIHRRAKATARSIYNEASQFGDKEEQKAVAQWAYGSQSKSRLENMLYLARSEQPIPLDHADLDADGWLLNCDNGTVDLHTGVLKAHNPGDLLTKSTGVEYSDHPGADAVLWTDTLDTIFARDTELIGFVQRLLGSALVGEVHDHILPIFYGSGANGKSVLIETAMAAMGDYSMKAPAGLLVARRNESHPTELADLYRTRLVAITETGDGQRLDERLVKELTGGDTIRARRMREDFWQFAPSHLALMVTNHKPIVRGVDYGIWRRLRLVPFEVTIPEEKQDRQLSQKLRAELPAILKWMVQGCLDWQKQGLAAPPQVMAATDDYKAESDTFGLWFEERCTAGERFQCKASQSFTNYKQWADENNERAMNQRKFGERIGERFTKERRNDGFHYVGFSLDSHT
ncbi:DNA primase family protein [Adhaeretor mobilis]|uniref:SF3 helicase domain-containing protein n=1 Tax=Adhaeretor mobilis TaxID=1930276 RepID=A0A517MS55_9BACT|nr:phage/plasmid primase, P4 family [Adhaeretor mobilis]QDS97705.1 hypothetical protein HG15A2_09690 [Adhaeretor mobilis]